jgi:hypothetical protein
MNGPPKIQPIRTRHPLRLGLAFAILAASAVCACATTEMEDDDAWFPRNEFYCDRDKDCVILGRDIHDCCACNPEPYAISRSALANEELVRKPCVCTLEEILCPTVTGHVDDFAAVCVRHTCEKRARK